MSEMSREADRATRLSLCIIVGALSGSVAATFWGAVALGVGLVTLANAIGIACALLSARA